MSVASISGSSLARLAKGRDLGLDLEKSMPPDPIVNGFKGVDAELDEIAKAFSRPFPCSSLGRLIIFASRLKDAVRMSDCCASHGRLIAKKPPE